jgi:hypothetical protein
MSKGSQEQANMEILKVQNITISPDSIRSAIAALEQAIDLHSRMKSHFEEILALQEGRAGAGRGPVIGLKPSRAGGRGRRPPGEMTLRQAILSVLARNKGPLKPVILRDKVLEAGYKTAATSQSFYTAVFNTARKEPGITKTSAGFQLKEGYSPEAAAGDATGAAKKRASPGRGRALRRRAARRRLRGRAAKKEGK